MDCNLAWKYRHLVVIALNYLLDYFIISTPYLLIAPL